VRTAGILAPAGSYRPPGRRSSVGKPHQSLCAMLSRAMAQLPNARLISLRDALQRRGQRRSMVFASATPSVIEAISIADEYGALCEAMFLVMAVERRMLNVQRS